MVRKKGGAMRESVTWKKKERRRRISKVSSKGIREREMDQKKNEKCVYQKEREKKREIKRNIEREVQKARKRERTKT